MEDAQAMKAKFEALGIATDFAPSALVAPFVGVPRVPEVGLPKRLLMNKCKYCRKNFLNTGREKIHGQMKPELKLRESLMASLDMTLMIKLILLR